MEMKDVSGEKRRAIVSKPCPDKATVQVFDVRSRKKKTVGTLFAVHIISFASFLHSLSSFCVLAIFVYVSCLPFMQPSATKSHFLHI